MVDVSIGAPLLVVPMQLATPVPNGPSLHVYAALITAPCAKDPPSAGDVIEIDGALVSVGQMVVVDSASDELGKQVMLRSALPSPEGRSALTIMDRPQSA